MHYMQTSADRFCHELVLSRRRSACSVSGVEAAYVEERPEISSTANDYVIILDLFNEARLQNIVTFNKFSEWNFKIYSDFISHEIYFISCFDM